MYEARRVPLIYTMINTMNQLIVAKEVFFVVYIVK